jgi:short-subunit dehydrogenase
MPTLPELLRNTSAIIVTGGSSGIGHSIIKAIIKLESSALICNISRTESDNFLGKQNYIHLATDLSNPDDLGKSAQRLKSILSKAAPGEVLLFNNSGFGDYGCQQTLNRSKQLNMIDLNIRAVVDLTTRLMPELLERGGCIINIASTAAFQPTPYLATYGASKAFVLNWTLALSEDLRKTKVRTLAICPGPTRTNFFKTAGFESPPLNQGANKMLDMSPEEVVDETLRALAKGKKLLVIGWKNKLIAFLGSKLPIVLVTRIGGAFLRRMRLEVYRKPQ